MANASHLRCVVHQALQECTGARWTKMIIALSACHSCTPASNPALLLRACYLTITCVHTRSQINDTPALLTPTTYFMTRYDKHAWLVGLLAYLARCSALQWAHQQLARGATLRIDRYPARQPVLRLWEPAEPSEVRLPNRTNPPTFSHLPSAVP